MDLSVAQLAQGREVSGGQLVEAVIAEEDHRAVGTGSRRVPITRSAIAGSDTPTT